MDVIVTLLSPSSKVGWRDAHNRVAGPLSPDEPNAGSPGSAQSGYPAFWAPPSRASFGQLQFCGHGLRGLPRLFCTTVLLGREELCGARSAAISAKLVAVYDAISADSDDVHEF
jgi:hypothetical protein